MFFLISGLIFPVKPVEDESFFCVRKSWAVILNCNGYASACNRSPECDPIALRAARVGNPVGERVVKKDDQDLTAQVFIFSDSWKSGVREFQEEPSAAGAAEGVVGFQQIQQQFVKFKQTVLYRDALFVSRGEKKQTADETPSSLTFVLNGGRKPCTLFRRICDSRGAGLYDGERGAQLMGGIADELILLGRMPSAFRG